MSSQTITSATIGFPRTGPNREMKKVLEAYWAGSIDGAALLAAAAQVEEGAWKAQADAGIQLVGLDGTLYDQVLDASFCLGLFPERFQELERRCAADATTGKDTAAAAAASLAPRLPLYFALARGAPGAPACDMSKLLDTNYHFIAPELSDASEPRPDWSMLLDRAARGQAAIGRERAVPLVVGPLTALGLARGKFDRATLLNRLTPAYALLLRQLAALGVPEVQMHEPVLTLSGSEALAAGAAACYAALAAEGVPINIVVPYDDVPEATYRWLVELPVAAISLDFLGVPGADYGSQTAQLVAKHGFPKDKRLGAGVIDGRGVWADDGQAARLVAALRARLGPDQRISVQPSTSLQHLPYDLAAEPSPPATLARPLAFAVQKLAEVVATAKAASSAGAEHVNGGGRMNGSAGKEAVEPLDLSTFTGAPKPAQLALSPEAFSRAAPYAERRPLQVQYPPLPTTTIGSFPQTPTIRRTRLAYKKGRISAEEYRERMAGEIGLCIGMQEALGLDVLVHGEPERSDMVEFFGLQLEGCWFSDHGWVQSYGSRYTRPPVIIGDISRPKAMTVHEYELAQGLTSKPVKGMLTGPVTILQWSFPRRDATRRLQAEQLAVALRGEVADLSAAGCRVLQVDEPALREGLPLKASRHESYLDWAVAAFRLATAAAPPQVQVVTHLCYSDFGEIMPAIKAMDADVLTIENSRSDDAMVAALAESGYPADVGPGVYDVHSPVVPPVDWLADRIRAFLKAGLLGGDATRIHVNPDCGLKTRRWEEVLPSLRNMVAAAQLVRAELAGSKRPPPGLEFAAPPAKAGNGGLAVPLRACPCCIAE